MIEIKTDENACQGYGNCVLNFPEAFDLSDAAVVVLKTPQVSADDAAKVRAAVADCPAGAISSSLDD